ncbi:hypothetical protein ACHAQA_004907 [Verticillium albo-atrum]
MDTPSATLLWDHLENLPLTQHLAEEELILLLTPVIVPPAATPDAQDPFEPLGRALAAQHPFVRHVPYTKQDGITSTHTAFVERSRVIVFVINGPPSDGEPSQAKLADAVSESSEERPLIIISCCDIRSHDLNAESFATIIQTASITPSALAQAADLLFKLPPSPSPPSRIGPGWSIQTWSPNRDLPAIALLWRTTLPKTLHLPLHALGPLLRRDGYAMHYTVRDPSSDALVAFCATYTTYPSTKTQHLLGSLALLLVHPDHRRHGIGRSLHDMAIAQLRRTRNVVAVALGSPFPRLLAGVPSDAGSDADIRWFARRGWNVRSGDHISDWVLSFVEAPPETPSKAVTTAAAPSELVFQTCGEGGLGDVVEFAERDAEGQGRIGYGEQFARLAGTTHVEDVVVGLEGQTIVAVALVYVPREGSPAAGDIPWARTLGEHVGGVTCVCVEDDNSEVVSTKHDILAGLLDACKKRLAQRGMMQIYVDGLRGNDESLQKLGFRRWLKYATGCQKVTGQMTPQTAHGNANEPATSSDMTLRDK